MGGGIPADEISGHYDNLDVAPTLYSRLGLPVPDGLTGRVIRELV
jgi:hypothetical protein